MNVYIWQSVENCSQNYHSGGGVVVFAESIGEAIELANKLPGCSIKPHETPDEVRPCGGDEKKVFIMPDAGCC